MAGSAAAIALLEDRYLPAQLEAVPRERWDAAVRPHTGSGSTTSAAAGATAAATAAQALVPMSPSDQWDMYTDSISGAPYYSNRRTGEVRSERPSAKATATAATASGASNPRRTPASPASPTAAAAAPQASAAAVQALRDKLDLDYKRSAAAPAVDGGILPGLEEYRRSVKRDAAEVVQARFEHRAAGTLQRAWRCTAARTRLAKRRLHFTAAATVQRAMRYAGACMCCYIIACLHTLCVLLQ
jgi:hypothetical protein